MVKNMMKVWKLLTFTGVVGPGPAEQCSFVLVPVPDGKHGWCAGVVHEDLPIPSLPLNRLPLPNPGLLEVGDHFVDVRHDGGVALLSHGLQLRHQDILVHLDDVRGRDVRQRINVVDEGRKFPVGRQQRH